MPTVTLTAQNSTGQTVSTNVSSNEAAFVAGVFSQEVFMSDFAVAQAAVDLVVAELANGTVAFILPGVNILIFPIGLVITSIWLAAFLATWGFGTFQRMSYREQFRRRTARLNGKAVNTI